MVSARSHHPRCANGWTVPLWDGARSPLGYDSDGMHTRGGGGEDSRMRGEGASHPNLKK